MKPQESFFSLAGIGRLLICLAVISGLLSLSHSTQPATAAQPGSTTAGVYRGVSTAVHFDISPAVRDLPVVRPSGPAAALTEMPERAGLDGLLPGRDDTDPIVQSTVGSGDMPDPLVSFNASHNSEGVSPPDPDGDVGPNHYVVMVNLHYAVYSKTGTLLAGPFLNNTLWAGFGGACETENAGDPVVLYDQFADRWTLAQFTSAGPTYYICVALSTTPDPTGTYYRWAFSTGSNFPDYPKYGIWGNAYTMSTREFGASYLGVGAYAVNRTQMLAGNPSPQIISFFVPLGSTPYNIGDGLLPADVDGFTQPVDLTTTYFMGTMDNDNTSYGAPQDALTLWKLHFDFATPSNSSFTLAQTIFTAPFDSMFGTCNSDRQCIPQPGTTNKVDILSYRQRPLFRLAYRNYGTHESLVTNQSVEAAALMAGVRWYEVRSPGSGAFIYQQGTYAPGVTDYIHRWMGSIAMDKAGNMALGYSASAASGTYPSVWYTGRLKNDPLGTMPQGEGHIVDGTGSQTSNARWGDYTAMSVDPVDDCTFWYVNEYYTSNGGDWQMRVGSFVYPSCLISGMGVEKTASPEDIVVPGALLTYTLNVSNTGPFSATVLAPARLTDTLPTGVALDSITAPANWTCGANGQTVSCSASDFPMGSDQEIILHTTAPTLTGYITNSVVITSTLGDPEPGNNQSSVITLVDQAPIANNDSYSFLEDHSINIIAPGFLANDSDPDADPLAVTLVTPPTNGTLAFHPDGSFDYTPAADNFGTVNFTYAISDSYLADTAVVTLIITGVNDAPSFTIGPNVVVNEDTAYAQSGWAKSIRKGPSNESSQIVAFTVVSNTNPALFSVLPAVTGAGRLTFTPALDASGVATVTLILKDNGGMANGGVDTSAPQSFTITVNPSNDAPSFTRGPDATVLEDSGVYTATGWATNILPGPANESTQVVTFTVTGNSNPALFGAGPLAAANGDLSFTPALDASGVATVTLVLKDSGGTANSGVDTSAAQVFTVTITPVNDVPSLTASDVTVDEDSGAYTAAWATGVPGPADEGAQTLTYQLVGSSNPALFSVPPALSASGNLSFTPAANAFGSATITVTVKDNGGTANGGVDTSAPKAYVITVKPVNDLPVATGDAFTTDDDEPYDITLHATDLESAALSYTVVVTPVHGVLRGSGANLTYTPANNYAGPDSFTFKANDGTDDSNVATIDITVTLSEGHGIYLPHLAKNAPATVQASTGGSTLSAWLALGSLLSALALFWRKI